MGSGGRGWGYVTLNFYEVFALVAAVQQLLEPAEGFGRLASNHVGGERQVQHDAAEQRAGVGRTCG